MSNFFHTIDSYRISSKVKHAIHELYSQCEL